MVRGHDVQLLQRVLFRGTFTSIERRPGVLVAFTSRPVALILRAELRRRWQGPLVDVRSDVSDCAGRDARDGTVPVCDLFHDACVRELARHLESGVKGGHGVAAVRQEEKGEVGVDRSRLMRWVVIPSHRRVFGLNFPAVAAKVYSHPLKFKLAGGLSLVRRGITNAVCEPRVGSHLLE